MRYGTARKCLAQKTKRRLSLSRRDIAERCLFPFPWINMSKFVACLFSTDMYSHGTRGATSAKCPQCRKWCTFSTSQSSVSYKRTHKYTLYSIREKNNTQKGCVNSKKNRGKLISKSLYFFLRIFQFPRCAFSGTRRSTSRLAAKSSSSASCPRPWNTPPLSYGKLVVHIYSYCQVLAWSLC